MAEFSFIAGALVIFHGWKYFWIINKTNLEISNLDKCDKISPRFLATLKLYWSTISSTCISSSEDFKFETFEMGITEEEEQSHYSFYKT